MGRLGRQRQIAILVPVAIYAIFVDQFLDQFDGIQRGLPEFMPVLLAVTFENSWRAVL